MQSREYNRMQEEPANRSSRIENTIKEIDQAHAALFYIPLAPSTVGEYVSGETPLILVSKEDGNWWVRAEIDTGSDVFTTLDRAKLAAAERVVDSYDRMQKSIESSLDLDLASWEVSLVEQDVVIKSLQDDRTIVCSGNINSWGLHTGDEFIQQFSKLSDAIAHDMSMASTPAGV